MKILPAIDTRAIPDDNLNVEFSACKSRHWQDPMHTWFWELQSVEMVWQKTIGSNLGFVLCAPFKHQRHFLLVPTLPFGNFGVMQ